MTETQDIIKKATFSLNTGSTCFLCLNDAFLFQRTERSDQIEQHDHKFSLQSICRLLRIHSGGVFKKTLALLAKDHQSVLNTEEMFLEEISNFSVMLCKKCSLLVVKLSDLCVELELLQMKVDYYLGSFCKVLRDPEANDGFSNKLIKSREAIDMVHGNLFKMLRTEMLEKCHMKLNSVLPKVLIAREGGLKVNGQVTSRNDPCLTIVENQKSASTLQVVISSSPPLVSAAPHPFITVPDENSTGSLPTLSCPLECSSSFAQVENLQQHKKSPQSQESQPVPGPTTNSPPKPQPTCEQCKISFNSASEWLKHTRKCTGAVNTIKTTAEIYSPPAAIQSTPKKETKSFVCTLCTPHLTLKSNNESRIHKIRNHVETLLSNCKLPALSRTEFKEYCEYVFKVELLSCGTSKDADGNPCCNCLYCSKTFPGQYNLRHHLFLEHKDIICKKLEELQKSTSISEIRETNLPIFSFPKNSQWNCVRCEAKFSTYTSFDKHRKDVHQSVMRDILKGTKRQLAEPAESTTTATTSNFKKKQNRKQSLISLPSIPSPVPVDSPGFELPNVQMDSPSISHTIITVKPSGRVRRNKTCNLCSPPRDFRGATELKRHEIRFHLETFFIFLKNPRHSMEAFKSFCDYVVNVEALSAKRMYTVTGNPTTKCPHCPTMLSCPLNVHLMSKHKEILNKKLVKLQETKSLVDIKAIDLLSVRDRTRFKCIFCKQTFRHEATLYKHKKSNCKLAPGEFECEYCGETFNHRESVLRHQEDKHNVPKDSVAVIVNLVDETSTTARSRSTISDEAERKPVTENNWGNDHEGGELFTASDESFNFHDQDQDMNDYQHFYADNEEEKFVADEDDDPIMILPHDDPLDI